MTRRLRDVEALPEARAQALLPGLALDDEAAEEADDEALWSGLGP